MNERVWWKLMMCLPSSLFFLGLFDFHNLKYKKIKTKKRNNNKTFINSNKTLNNNNFFY